MEPTARAGFGAGAGEYERARPGYPERLADILERELGLWPGAPVCDLAAGTGKLTRLLVARRWRVVAVEPVAEMREELARAVPGAVALEGTAASIPVPDASIRAVTVAQAFHWFDAGRALAEIRRILEPGGGLAVVFNRRDEREPWVARMSEAIGWHERSIARYQEVDWGAVLEGGGFGPVGRETLEWSQPVTRELLASRVRSISYVAAAPEPERKAYVERVLALVEGVDEPFDLPHVTEVWWGRLISRGGLAETS